MDLVMPLTAPVKVGLANGAFKSRAPCVALEMGLFESEVLSTLPRPTIDLVMPLTVPMKVGLANRALLLRAPCVALEMGLLASDVLSDITEANRRLSDASDGTSEGRACLRSLVIEGALRCA